MYFCLFQNHCLPNGALQIRDVTMRDAGNYRCLAKTWPVESGAERPSCPSSQVCVCVRMNGDHYQMHFWNKWSRSLPLNRLCSSPASGPRPLMKPHIIAGPQNISVGLRQSVVLECFAEGKPSAACVLEPGRL